MTAADLPIELIDQPVNPLRGRIDTQGLEELVESIKAVGLLQSLLVKRVGQRFEVIAGHRRLLAAGHAGLKLVPCRIVDGELEGKQIAAMLHENLFRRDLTPIEEAVTYAELYETAGDIDVVAKMVDRSRGVVEARLALLTGDETVRDALGDGKISLGVAEQLNKVPEESTRRFLLDAAINDGASVQKVTGWRKMYMGLDVGAAAVAAAASSPDPSGERVVDPNFCWLCGSNEDQHDLRVRLVHAACERMARRAGAGPAQQEAVNGGD